MGTSKPETSTHDNADRTIRDHVLDDQEKRKVKLQKIEFIPSQIWSGAAVV